MLKHLQKLKENGSFAEIRFEEWEATAGFVIGVDEEDETFVLLHSEVMGEGANEFEMVSLDEDGMMYQAKPKEAQPDRKIVESVYHIGNVIGLTSDVSHRVSRSQVEVLEARRNAIVAENAPKKRGRRKAVAKA